MPFYGLMASARLPEVVIAGLSSSSRCSDARVQDVGSRRGLRGHCQRGMISNSEFENLELANEARAYGARWRILRDCRSVDTRELSRTELEQTSKQGELEVLSCTAV
jgi:hypothetical protein